MVAIMVRLSAADGGVTNRRSLLRVPRARGAIVASGTSGPRVVRITSEPAARQRSMWAQSLALEHFPRSLRGLRAVLIYGHCRGCSARDYGGRRIIALLPLEPICQVSIIDRQR